MANPAFSLKLKSEKSSEESVHKVPVIGITVGIIFIFFVIIPKAQTWSELNNKNEEFSTSVKMLEKKTAQLEEEKNLLEIEKKEKAGDDINREAQILPTKINTFKIADTLEILAIQLDNTDIDRDAKFSINSIRFSGSEPVDGVYANKANLSIEGDLISIKPFLHYLKTGEIPEVIKIGGEEGIVDNNILAALQNELLPLATIEKIQVNQTRDETVYKAEMLINFYSRES